MLVLGSCRAQDEAPAAPSVATSPPGSRVVESAHYRLTSSADEGDTQATLAAAESLYRAYTAFFDIPATPLARRHELVLYRDREQFKRYTRSRPWAEAYYLAPACHAYVDRGRPNPHHWMIHEATHQLSREVSRFPRRAWTDEGLGTYFGASRIENGELQIGRPDPNAYPLWWLSSLRLTDEVQHDIDAGELVGLRTLITGRGKPSIDEAVNAWYIGYWSLTHFLFHGAGGRYADAYRQLIARGGELRDFESSIGPLDRIQREWHAYLRYGLGEIFQ